MGRPTVEENSTPCPVRSTRTSNYYHSAPFADEPTENVDFTREILPAAEVLNYKSLGELKKKGLKQPPRRITHHVPLVRLDRQEQVPSREKKVTVNEPEVLIETKKSDPERKPLGLQQLPRRSMMPGRRRVSAILKARENEYIERRETKVVEEQDNFLPIGKRTVLGDKRSTSNIQVQILSKQSQQEKKQLHAPPKRMPLQPNPKPPQRGTAIGAVRERNSGKENLPPAEPRASKRVKTSQGPPTRKSARLSGDGLQKGSLILNQKANEVQSIVQKPITTAPVLRRRSRKRNSDTLSSDVDTSFTSETSSTSHSLRLIKRQRKSNESLPSPPSLTVEEEAEIVPPSDFLLPGIISQKPIRKSGGRRLDPLLRDDLARCEMYEESWLSAQESSVTQLLNQLLEEYSPAPIGKPRLSLRHDFLKMYSAAPFPLVYNRVHASLLYGALSITQSLIEKSSSSRLSRAAANTLGHLGWGNDLGLRTKFLDLFAGSYEHSVLVTGLEVVVGREMFAFADPGDSEKKILEGYIERYVIKSEDILATIPSDVGQKKRKGVHIDGGDEDRGSPAWLLRRSLLRSFMLILLFDKAKSEGIIGRQCLFKKTSSYKSSAAILTALSRLLLPSMGEASKPLSHLNYSLTTNQTSLTEYFYTIDNIAIDMRDGVRLTRVVEVLLNSKRRTSLSSEEGAESADDWPLTPHLQYPAPSRAQKLHNVSLALSYLGRVQGNPSRIEAKDIVDGHREKTVGLLWSLLSRWGLELLVDWESVKDEIRRFERLAYPGLLEDEDEINNMMKKDHTLLLQDWARCVGSKHSLVVNNLTTSFADGRVFEAIVNEYQQYLPSLAKADKSATLGSKLKGIGCNSYFASLFESQLRDGRVFNEEFVLAGLAYLCSRLLQPSIMERAAITIQRSYRNCVACKTIHKRINLLLIAHDCAEVVNNREKMLKATITIQRAYRTYLQDKIETLIQRMTLITSAGRGYLARKGFEYTRSAVIIIQRRWRVIREVRYHSRMGVAKGAVIGFQAIARGALVRGRQLSLKRAVVYVENRWSDISLGFQIRVDFLEMKFAAEIIQRLFRRYTETRNERAWFLSTYKNVKIIQNCARGFVARVRYNQKISASFTIQDWYRRSVETNILRNNFLILRYSAMIVQQRRRETIIARQLREQYLKLKSAILVVERRYIDKKRTENATIVLQKAWRKHVWLVRMRRILQEAVVIQSAWRGYLIRKTASPRLRIIRKRLDRIVIKGVELEEMLGARTKKSLGFLKTKAGFARGIQQLDSLTGNCTECIQIVAEDWAGLSAILTFVETSAPQVQKSSASMTARNLASSINVLSRLAHIAKASAIIVPKSANIIATLVLVIETLKAAVTNTPQHDMLFSSMRMLEKFTQTAAIKRQLVSRKKLVSRLQATLKDIQSGGKNKRRGVNKEDKAKADVTTALLKLL